MKFFRTIAIALVFLGVGASLFLAGERITIENATKHSSLVLEWNQIEDLANRENITVPQALSMLSADINGVLFKEELLSEMANKNRLIIQSGNEMIWQNAAGSLGLDNHKLNSNYTYLIFTDKNDLDRVQRHILSKLPKGTYCAPLEEKIADSYVLETSALPATLNSLGVGFSTRKLDMVKNSGLEIFAQIRSWANYSEQGVDTVFADLAGYPVAAVGFNDTEIAGSNLPAEQWTAAKNKWATTLTDLKIPLINIEFFAQKGIQSLGYAMNQQVLRMHPINENEIKTLTPARIVDRFVLAASERNMKILFVRFLPQSSMEDNLHFLGEIKSGIAAKGVALGGVSAAPYFFAAPLWQILIALAVISGGWLLLQYWGLKKLSYVIAGGAVVLLAGLSVMGRWMLLEKLFSLLSVLIFPTLSMSLFVTAEKKSLPKAILAFLKTTAFSLIGAVLMIGLMSNGNFMVKLDQFMGVKIAHLLPVLMVPLFIWWKNSTDASPLAKCTNVLKMDVKVIYLLIGGIIMAVLGLYLMRTGNDAGNVSELERSFRALLDNVLYVRPRTKEFALGNPLLLLIFYYGYKDKLLPVLLLGAIGQVSLVNTFAHIHTPVLISVIRTLNGLWLGVLIGVILIVCLKAVQKLLKKYNIEVGW